VLSASPVRETENVNRVTPESPSGSEGERASIENVGISSTSCSKTSTTPGACVQARLPASDANVIFDPSALIAGSDEARSPNPP